MSGFVWTDGATGFIDVDGASLEVLSLGLSPIEAPTIVMLHEGLGCVALWRDFPLRIAQSTGFGVLVYSRSGYGQSSNCVLPRPVDYMNHEALEILPRVLDAIGFRQGILLGHSDGATIAAIHAGLSGDHRVRGLVLIAPHFFTEASGLKAIADAKEAYDHDDLRTRLARYHRDVDCAFRGWNDAWCNPDFRDWNVADVIDYWRIPVLAIQGRNDQYGTLAQIHAIENRIYSPLDTLFLDDCGHAPHLEKPQQTLAVVTDFAQRLQRIEAERVTVK